MAILTLYNSETPDTIQTDEYFSSGIDTLSIAGIDKIDLFFRESIYPKIKEIMDQDPDNLINLRIIGHTDAEPPKKPKIKNRRWKTNRELSQFRANQVAEIIENVVKDSLPNDQYVEIKNKILSGGYGSSHPHAEIIPHNNGWSIANVADKDSIDKAIKILGYIKGESSTRSYTDEELKLIIIDGPFSDKGVAIRKAYKLNRRVEVSIIKKGY